MEATTLREWNFEEKKDVVEMKNRTCYIFITKNTRKGIFDIFKNY